MLVCIHSGRQSESGMTVCPKSWPPFHRLIYANDGKSRVREPGTDEEVYFVNIPAFIARLAALNILDGTLWAMSIIKDTLENEPSARYYSSHISAAALWILCAGQWLCDEVLRPREANPSGGGIWHTDGLYTRMDSTYGNFGKKLLRLRLIVSMHRMSGGSSHLGRQI